MGSSLFAADSNELAPASCAGVARFRGGRKRSRSAASQIDRSLAETITSRGKRYHHKGMPMPFWFVSPGRYCRSEGDALEFQEAPYSVGFARSKWAELGRKHVASMRESKHLRRKDVAKTSSKGLEHMLKDVLKVSICSFLQVKDVCRLRATCSRLRDELSPYIDPANDTASGSASLVKALETLDTKELPIEAVSALNPFSVEYFRERPLTFYDQSQRHSADAADAHENASARVPLTAYRHASLDDGFWRSFTVKGDNGAVDLEAVARFETKGLQKFGALETLEIKPSFYQCSCVHCKRVASEYFIEFAPPIPTTGPSGLQRTTRSEEQQSAESLQSAVDAQEYDALRANDTADARAPEGVNDRRQNGVSGRWATPQSGGSREPRRVGDEEERIGGAATASSGCSEGGTCRSDLSDDSNDAFSSSSEGDESHATSGVSRSPAGSSDSSGRRSAESLSRRMSSYAASSLSGGLVASTDLETGLPNASGDRPTDRLTAPTRRPGELETEEGIGASPLGHFRVSGEAALAETLMVDVGLPPDINTEEPLEQASCDNDSSLSCGRGSTSGLHLLSQPARVRALTNSGGSDPVAFVSLGNVTASQFTNAEEVQLTMIGGADLNCSLRVYVPHYDASRSVDLAGFVSSASRRAHQSAQSHNDRRAAEFERDLLQVDHRTTTESAARGNEQQAEISEPGQLRVLQTPLAPQALLQQPDIIQQSDLRRDPSLQQLQPLLQHPDLIQQSQPHPDSLLQRPQTLLQQPEIIQQLHPHPVPSMQQPQPLMQLPDTIQQLHPHPDPSVPQPDFVPHPNLAQGNASQIEGAPSLQPRTPPESVEEASVIRTTAEAVSNQLPSVSSPKPVGPNAIPWTASSTVEEDIHKARTHTFVRFLWALRLGLLSRKTLKKVDFGEMWHHMSTTLIESADILALPLDLRQANGRFVFENLTHMRFGPTIDCRHIVRFVDFCRYPKLTYLELIGLKAHYQFLTPRFGEEPTMVFGPQQLFLNPAPQPGSPEELTPLWLPAVYNGAVDQEMKLQGRGLYVSREYVYEGEFKDGQNHGYGRMISKCGETYDGHWHRGRRHGYGVVVQADGKRLEGEWRGDVLHGRGAMEVPGGLRYEGEWQGGALHGWGVLTRNNFLVAFGTFKEGKPLGWARCRVCPFAALKSGAVFRGTWLAEALRFNQSERSAKSRQNKKVLEGEAFSIQLKGDEKVLDRSIDAENDRLRPPAPKYKSAIFPYSVEDFKSEEELFLYEEFARTAKCEGRRGPKLITQKFVELNKFPRQPTSLEGGGASDSMTARMPEERGSPAGSAYATESCCAFNCPPSPFRNRVSGSAPNEEKDEPLDNSDPEAGFQGPAESLPAARESLVTTYSTTSSAALEREPELSVLQLDGSLLAVTPTQQTCYSPSAAFKRGVNTANGNAASLTFPVRSQRQLRSPTTAAVEPSVDSSYSIASPTRLPVPDCSPKAECTSGQRLQACYSCATPLYSSNDSAAANLGQFEQRGVSPSATKADMRSRSYTKWLNGYEWYDAWYVPSHDTLPSPFKGISRNVLLLNPKLHIQREGLLRHYLTGVDVLPEVPDWIEDLLVNYQ